MKILLASTIKRNVTKDTTYSRSKIVYQIASGLAKRGHNVSLLGTADSVIEGVKVIPAIDKGFVDKQKEEGYENPFYAEAGFLVKFAKKLEEIGDEFDVIHNHSYPEFLNLLAGEQIKTPMVTTLHAQATAEYDDVLGLFPKANLISISNAHKKMFKKANIRFVVQNGVDTGIFSLEKQKDNYLLWMGRLGRAKDKDGNFVDAKGIRWAIELARKTGERLLICGNVEDMGFYDKDVKPFLDDKIRWFGPVSSEQALSQGEVAKLMQKAKAFLFPINWEEPFGLVMIEAMACGTPVIGFDRGSVSELISDGKTGYVVSPSEGVDGLEKALQKISIIDSNECRRHVEENFSLEKMIDNYEKVYQEVAAK
ncbi:MAG: glycosyltransferase family 4 protein [Patescibacteria group bacterium]|nr:glycosyltransferase family 4 protein [Patescibacteria group bacterium]